MRSRLHYIRPPYLGGFVAVWWGWVKGVGVVYSQGGWRVQEAMFRGYLFDRFKMLAVMSIGLVSNLFTSGEQ